jgi:hypothetical protein
MILNLTELAIFSVILIVTTGLVINNIRLFFETRRLMALVVQATVDKLTIEETLDKVVAEYELVVMRETDGFVKFLSESRESAFVYIEEVQASIKKLSHAMNSGDELAITNAYKNLVEHMPKEETK